MSDPKILVTGASGTFGGAVATQLRQAGLPFRALVRDPSRYSAGGGELGVGDFADPASLDAALSGIERVFLASFDRNDALRLQRNMIEACQRQGVRQIARISSIGVDDPTLGPILVNHAMGERQLEASGLGYTHLRPSWVLQNFLPSSAATPVKDGKIRLPAGAGRVGFVDARDVAAVAVAALTTPGHEGRTYTLTGSSLHSHGELAEALGAAAGRSITYEELSPDAYADLCRAAGWPAASIESMNALFADMRGGGAAFVTDDVVHATGRPARSIQDFARDHAAAFAA